MKEQVSPKKAEDGLRPGNHRTIGFINRHGVLFPPGYQFTNGHICWQGFVNLRQCPKCKHVPSMSTEVIKGVCEEADCGYSAVEELERVEL
jgi:hypothetical protein